MNSIEKLSNLTNRTALITGAFGQLGSVFSRTLAEMGANLILIDLPHVKNSDFISEITEKYKVKVLFLPCDLELQENRKNLILKLNELKIKINILINNAALVGDSKLKGWNVDFQNQSIETWRKAIEVNLTSIFELTQGVIPLMKNSPGANIVNIASIYGLFGPDWKLYEDTNMGNPAAYSASKSGLIGLTRWLSTTLAPEIRVNAIAPGGIILNQNISFIEKYNLKTPLNRMAQDDDFIGVIQYLSSDLAKYVTGQVLVVDGGFGVW